MSSSKAQPIPEEKWLRYEPFIRHCLVAKDMKVEEVVTKLASHNFRIKKSQLEHRISRLQIGKAIRPEIWRHVGLQIAKRQRENRESRVIHRGKTLELSKVKGQTARNRTFTCPASPDSDLIASAEVVICTPPVFPHEPAWPGDLPWLRFYDQTFIPLASHALQAMDLNREQRAMTAELIVTTGHRSIFRLNPASAKLQVSQLETIIGTSMPEYYPGENRSRAQSLLKGSDKEVLQATLSVVLYNLSNNLFDPFDDHDWELKVQVLQDCGIMSLPLPAMLDVTMNGIIRSLFYAALWQLTRRRRNDNRSEGLAVLCWTLSAGQIPTSSVFIPDLNVTITPLQAALCSGDLEVAEILLHGGADPNFTSTAYYASPLELALRCCPTSGRLEMIHALFKHGATTHLDVALRLAVESQDFEISKAILQGTPDILDTPEEPIEPLLKQIVHEAASHRDAKRLGFAMDLLSHLCPARPLKDFVTVEAFTATAGMGHNDNVLLLHSMSGRDTPIAKSGLTPLHASAKGGHRDTCALLLSLYGSDILNSCYHPPLHLASICGHGSIVQLFIDEGANTNALSAVNSWPGGRNTFGKYGSRITDRETSKPLPALQLVREVLRSTTVPTDGPALCAAALIRAGGRVMTGDVVLAVAHKSPKLLSAVLDFGGDPNEMSEEGLTALQLSLRTTDPVDIHTQNHTAELAGILLANGASVTGWEANLAAVRGYWTLVDRLLPKGEVLFDFNDGSMTALEAAIACCDSECLNKALELQPCTYSPGCLCAAIDNEEYWLIDYLLAHRGARSQPDCLEGTAIGLAVLLEDLTLLRKLLTTLLPQPVTAKMPSELDSWEHPDNSDKYGCWWRSEDDCVQVSPLAVAAYHGVTDAFHELLLHGFLADQVTWSVIGSYDKLSMARALLNNNQCLQLDGWSSSEEFTDPLTCPDPLPGSDALRDSNPEVYPDFLLSSGAAISSDPLIGSIRSRNKELVLLILESYPNINRHYWFLGAKSGFTPLQAAVDTGDFDLTELFLHRGADVNVPPAIRNGATALQFAAMRGHLGIAKRLIDLGADPNAPAALINGRTALEGAAENGRLDMLQLLLGRGTLTKGDGRHQYVRAIKLAIRQGHPAAEMLLRGHRNWEEEDVIIFEQEEDFERKK